MTTPPAPADTGEIIVTAQKKSESLQRVPISVAALGGPALQQRGITDIQNLQVAMPGITVGTSFGFANLFIRGLGLNSVFANVDPSVTLHEDGAVISQPAAQLFAFFDLDRVEVLRGPQGTLYGRNATGGTVNLITAKPSDVTSGFIRAQVGNYAAFESEGAIGGPIATNLSARLSYFATRHDGYGRNLVTGNDVNDADTRAVRGQLRFKPSPKVDLLLSGEYGRENDRGNALQFKRETFPGVLNDGNPANDSLAAPGIGGFPTGNPRDYASNIDPANKRDTWSVSATAKIVVTDDLTLTNITNYRNFSLNMAQDLDLSSVVSSSVNNFIIDDHHWSEELQANLETGRLSGVGGFYYFSERVYNENIIGVGPRTGEYDVSKPGNGRRVYLTGTGWTKTWALFWNGSYRLTDHLTIQAGGRYTHDHRRIDNDNYIWVPAAASCAGTINSSVVSGRIQCHTTGPDDARSFNNYSTQAGVQWRPVSNIMAYYSFSQGFKAGTGQLGTSQTAPPFIINPEKIQSHEIGLKNSFAGGRYILNIAAYTYKVDDVQLDRTIPGGPAGYTTIWENATSQHGKGIEVDGTFRPSPVFRGNVSLSMQKTRFGSFISADPINPLLFDPANPALRVDIAGNRARNAPTFAGTLELEHDIRIAADHVLTVYGSATHKSRVYFTEFNDAIMSQGNYTMFDAGARFNFGSGRWTAGLFVKNITNKLVEGADFALGTGRAIGRTFLAPRTFGGSLSYRL